MKVNSRNTFAKPAIASRVQISRKEIALRIIKPKRYMPTGKALMLTMNLPRQSAIANTVCDEFTRVYSCICSAV